MVNSIRTYVDRLRNNYVFILLSTFSYLYQLMKPRADSDIYFPSSSGCFIFCKIIFIDKGLPSIQLPLNKIILSNHQFTAIWFIFWAYILHMLAMSLIFVIGKHIFSKKWIRNFLVFLFCNSRPYSTVLISAPFTDIQFKLLPFLLIFYAFLFQSNSRRLGFKSLLIITFILLYSISKRPSSIEFLPLLLILVFISTSIRMRYRFALAAIPFLGIFTSTSNNSSAGFFFYFITKFFPSQVSSIWDGTDYVWFGGSFIDEKIGKVNLDISSEFTNYVHLVRHQSWLVVPFLFRFLELVFNNSIVTFFERILTIFSSFFAAKLFLYVFFMMLILKRTVMRRSIDFPGYNIGFTHFYFLSLTSSLLFNVLTRSSNNQAIHLSFIGCILVISILIEILPYFRELRREFVSKLNKAAISALALFVLCQFISMPIIESLNRIRERRFIKLEKAFESNEVQDSKFSLLMIENSSVRLSYLGSNLNTTARLTLVSRFCDRHEDTHVSLRIESQSLGKSQILNSMVNCQTSLFLYIPISYFDRPDRDFYTLDIVPSNLEIQEVKGLSATEPQLFYFLGGKAVHAFDFDSKYIPESNLFSHTLQIRLKGHNVDNKPCTIYEMSNCSTQGNRSYVSTSSVFNKINTRLLNGYTVNISSNSPLLLERLRKDGSLEVLNLPAWTTYCLPSDYRFSTVKFLLDDLMLIDPIVKLKFSKKICPTQHGTFSRFIFFGAT